MCWEKTHYLLWTCFLLPSSEGPFLLCWKTEGAIIPAFIILPTILSSLTFLPAGRSSLCNCSTDGNYSCVWSSFSEPFPSLSWGKVGGGMGWTDGRKMTDQSWSIQNVGVRGYTAESVSALFFSSPLIIFNYHSVVLSIKLIFLSMSNNSKILLPSLLFHLKPIV